MENAKEEAIPTELENATNGLDEMENSRQRNQYQPAIELTCEEDQSGTQNEQQLDVVNEGDNLEINSFESNVFCEDYNRPSEVMATGEVVEDEMDYGSVNVDVHADEEETWHLAHATAVEPEVILFAVPADTLDTQWFGDKYVKKAVVVALFLSFFTVLSLACTILVMTTKHYRQNEENARFIECIQFPEYVDCPTQIPLSYAPVPKENIRIDEEKVVFDIASSVSDLKSINTFESPQNKSLASTYIQMQSNHRVSNTTLQNRYILGVLYFSLDGSNWRSSENWLTSKPVCSWENIVCKHQQPTQLIWSDQNLSGSIPKELTNLKSLEKIDFGNNAIVGSIPDNIDSLENLEILLLNENSISGTIPESIVLNSLRKLSLNSNLITGAIPELILNGNEKEENKSFFDENLSNISKEQTKLNHLEYLNLSGNRISGSIPESIKTCSKLQTVVLSNNRLDGPIPEAIVELKNLRVLELQSNDISGIINDDLRNLTKLEKLDLSNTNILGTIPNEVCDRLTEKKHAKINVDCDQILCNCCTLCDEL